MKRTIINSIQQVSEAFHQDELAFLALTSKIEAPIRDKWAYLLYKKLASDELTVAREWKRVDLAILQGGKPKALIELTAMYSFDALVPQNLKNYAEKLARDAREAVQLSERDTVIYTVLLATHPATTADREFEGIIKYRKDINKALQRFGGAAQVMENTLEEVKKKLKDMNVVTTGTLPGGMAYGIKVNIMYWVLEHPLSNALTD